jgi:hypothetical protein
MLLHRFEQALATRRCAIGAAVGQRLLRQAAAKPWVVYSKAPMAGPAQVLRYLGLGGHPNPAISRHLKTGH